MLFFINRRPFLDGPYFRVVFPYGSSRVEASFCTVVVNQRSIFKISSRENERVYLKTSLIDSQSYILLRYLSLYSYYCESNQLLGVDSFVRSTVINFGPRIFFISMLASLRSWRIGFYRFYLKQTDFGDRVVILPDHQQRF